MCKKLLIAAVAVVVGLVAIRGTRLAGILRVKWNNATTWAKNQVKPETELERLRADLRDLARKDDQHFDLVAQQEVKVEKLERKVAALRGNVTRTEANLRTLRRNLKDGTVEVVFLEGVRYTRDEAQQKLRLDFITFQSQEEQLKTEQERLKAFKETLAANKRKLRNLSVARREMEAELNRLETTLARERAAQIEQNNLALDDSGYSRVRQDISALRDRIAVMQKTRELKGETLGQPSRSVKDRERDAQIDKAIEARLGKTPERVAGK
jgi:peptidoglycan hydrolase CwlO-like protein